MLKWKDTVTNNEIDHCDAKIRGRPFDSWGGYGFFVKVIVQQIIENK